MRKIEQISISEADRERLERLVRDRNTPQKVVWRARIVLLASDGLGIVLSFLWPSSYYVEMMRHAREHQAVQAASRHR